jgi:hypothetical protein
MSLKYSGWVLAKFFVHFLAMYLQCTGSGHHPLPLVIAARALLKQSVVASVTNTGAHTAVELHGLNFCKCLSFGLNDVLGFEVCQGPRPHLRDHLKTFTGKLGANEECEGTANCNIIF